MILGNLRTKTRREMIDQVSKWIPKPMAWNDRKKGADVLKVPEDEKREYLPTLRRICERVSQNRVSVDVLSAWIHKEFKNSETASPNQVRFLIKAGLISKDDEKYLVLTEEVRHWMGGGAIDRSRVAALPGMAVGAGNCERQRVRRASLI